jgi:FkbM family methyltransferase
MRRLLQGVAMRGEALGTVVETQQGFFCVDDEDQYVTKALLERGAYGAGEIAMISRFLRPSTRMLLVGAHIGALLIPLSRSVQAMVGIEANPRTFRKLHLNVLMNERHNVRLFNLAASDAAGSLEFVMGRTNTGSSKRMPLIKAERYFYDNPDVTQVPAARLDELLPHESFDVVFMDIEGSELFAMRGMPRILATAQVVVAEFYPFMVREVAGAGVEEFLEPLQDFETLIIPSLRKSVFKPDFRAALQDMFDHDKCDNGIFFLREHVEIRFGD